MSGSAARLTLDEYEQRLLDGDRWIELMSGRLVRLEAPDETHGDVVRNLARPLAQHLKSLPDITACFELPLILSRDPATIRCPAISCFQSPDRFAETEKLVTDTRPLLVIEVASTNDRRDGMSERVKGYLDAGIPGVWVIDPVTRHVHQFHPPARGMMLKETQTLSGDPVLPGFRIPVLDLFQQPHWSPPDPENS